MLTIDRLKERLFYDPDTGIFKWRVKPRQRACNEIAGTLNPDGYRQICIDQKIYKAHRLAWFYVHNEWPDGLIDHINMDKSDNRISNLRIATMSQNIANGKVRPTNKSGLKGVYFNKKVGFWYARIMVNYKRIHLGCFKTKEEAHEAYVAGSKKHFGEYARAE